MTLVERAESTYREVEVGFHGDTYLLALVDALLDRSEAFVETGTNVGSTLRYVAARRPQLPCLSCEPDAEAFARAAARTRGLANVALFRLDSVAFLEQVLDAQPHLAERPTLFWLDAHGYGFRWPLREEVRWITERFAEPLILIDDFEVPGRAEFGFDAYDGQVCGLAEIEEAIAMPYDLHLPGYSERTSPFHPLRGWGLITRPGSFAPPAHLRDAVVRERALYSQNGEDAVIAEAFADVRDGFFVEVGCIDGRLFSNTLALEQAGWSGLCVEAHADYVAALCANRSGSTVVHAAVDDVDGGTVEFHANARGSLSTLDASLEPHWREHYGPWFSGFELQRVPRRTISSLLDELGSPHVHVLSVDVEGTDARALRGLDLTRHRPSLIVVEAAVGGGDEIDERLLGAGYVRGPVVGGNVFYFAEPERAARVAGRTFRCVVTRTPHPLDGGDEQLVELEVRT